MNTLAVILFSLSTIFNTPTSVNPEREAMLDKMFILLEENIANPNWLTTNSFKKFKKELYSDKVLKMSDEDFINFFRQQRKTLSFTHLSLSSKKLSKQGNSNTGKNQPMSWKPLSKDIAYLDVRTFSTDASPMVKILSEIGVDNYKHLIIDLRDNGGGSVYAPVV